VLSEQTDDWFSWTIAPPLTASFLGASYWAAFVLFAWTAARGDRNAAAAALVPVSLIALLLLIATVIHEERFHDDLFGWFWKAAYVLAPLAIAAVVIRQQRARDSARARRSPLPPGLRTLLAVQGLTMLVTGAFLFVSPDTAIWPWDLTPLTARAVGAFVTGFGASALHAVVANDLSRFAGAALAYAALGMLELVGLARYSDSLTGADLDSSVYAVFLATILAAGLYGYARARHATGGGPGRVKR
jgi:hypothetical protein